MPEDTPKIASDDSLFLREVAEMIEAEKTANKPIACSDRIRAIADRLDSAGL